MSKETNEQNVIALFQQSRPLFIALGDENRQQIIVQLLETEYLSVNQIAGESHLSRPAVSHHLKVLRDEGIVSVQRRGTQRLYRLADAAIAQVELLERLAVALKTCAHWQITK